MISRHTGAVPAKNFEALLVMSCPMTGTQNIRCLVDSKLINAKFVSYNSQALLFVCLPTLYLTSWNVMKSPRPLYLHTESKQKLEPIKEGRKALELGYYVAMNRWTENCLYCSTR